MASKDDYAAIANEIARYFNAYRLAFKTYQVADLDKMIKVRAGDGARLSTAKVAEEFETMLLQRGFMCFPSIATAEDGYVRIFRTGTVAANLLQAFLNPGPTGDEALGSLLRKLWAPRSEQSNDPENESH